MRDSGFVSPLRGCRIPLDLLIPYSPHSSSFVLSYIYIYFVTDMCVYPYVARLRAIRNNALNIAADSTDLIPISNGDRGDTIR